MAAYGFLTAARSPDLVLYHAWMSSASRRVRFCLEEKGLAYESAVLDLQKNEQHTPEYCAINPNGFVPTLIHKGRTLIESTVIGEYLDEAFPDRPLRPMDPHARAAMRVWTKYVDEIVIRVVQVASWNRIIRPVAMQWTDEEMALALARIPTPDRREDWRRMAREPFTDREIGCALDGVRHMLTKMEQALSQHAWLAGVAFSLADIHVAPYIVRLGEFAAEGLQLQPGSALAAWWERLSARPAYAAARITPLGGAPGAVAGRAAAITAV